MKAEPVFLIQIIAGKKLYFKNYYNYHFKIVRMRTAIATNQNWPDIPFDEWKDTLDTVQLWVQIAGKIRLRKMPWINHSWHTTLYVSPRGLTTGSIPFENGIFQIDFDFLNHRVLISSSTGKNEQVDLYPRSVADFYKELFEKLEKMQIDAVIYAVPNEVEPAISFEKDERHKSYDKEKMTLYWQALVTIYNVFIRFRAKFIGKCSPVHLFWGAFDFAVTRFSGREAPIYTAKTTNIPLRVMQEAYSHEVSSCGFWPGNEQFPQPAFYSYCYPAPAGLANSQCCQKKLSTAGKWASFFFLTRLSKMLIIRKKLY